MRVDRGDAGCVVLLLAIAIALVLWFVISAARVIERDRRACEDRGGHYVKGVERLECIP